MRQCGGQRWLFVFALWYGVWIAGCASWTDRSRSSDEVASPLVPLRENQRNAALEFEFVPIVLMKAAKALESPGPAPGTGTGTGASDDPPSESDASNDQASHVSADSPAVTEAASATDPAWAMSPAASDSLTQQSTEQLIQSLWQWVDETGIDPQLRRRLSENGLRIGRVLDRERFRTRLKALAPDRNRVDEFLQQADVATETTQGRQRIPMRTGRRYELPLRQPMRGAHVSLVRLNDETVGKSLVDPQFLFAVSVSPGASAGELRVKMRPEIQHGAMKQTWVSSDSALRIDTRRSVWSLESLEMEWVGTEEDLFVISSLESTVGLGSQMFVGTAADGSTQHTLLLVRLANVPTSIDQL